MQHGDSSPGSDFSEGLRFCEEQLDQIQGEFEAMSWDQEQRFNFFFPFKFMAEIKIWYLGHLRVNLQVKN